MEEKPEKKTRKKRISSVVQEIVSVSDTTPTAEVKKETIVDTTVVKSAEELAAEEVTRQANANLAAIHALTGQSVPQIKIEPVKPKPKPVVIKPNAVISLEREVVQQPVIETPQATTPQEIIWYIPDSFLNALHKKIEEINNPDLTTFYLQNLKADWKEKPQVKVAQPINIAPQPVQQVAPQHTAQASDAFTAELVQYAESLHRELTTSNAYHRNQNVARSEVERHLKQCPTYFVHVIKDDHIEIKDTRTGDKTNTNEIIMV